MFRIQESKKRRRRKKTKAENTDKINTKQRQSKNIEQSFYHEKYLHFYNSCVCVLSREWKSKTFNTFDKYWTCAALLQNFKWLKKKRENPLFNLPSKMEKVFALGFKAKTK